MAFPPLTLADVLKGARSLVSPHSPQRAAASGAWAGLAATKSNPPQAEPSRFAPSRPPAPQKAPSVPKDPIEALLTAPVQPVSAAKKRQVAQNAVHDERFPAVNSLLNPSSWGPLAATTLKETLQDVFTLGDVASKMASPAAYPLAQNIRERAKRPFRTVTQDSSTFDTPLFENAVTGAAKLTDGLLRGADWAKREMIDKPSQLPDLPPTETIQHYQGKTAIPGQVLPNPAYANWLESHGYGRDAASYLTRDQVIRMEAARNKHRGQQQQRLVDQGEAADPAFKEAVQAADVNRDFFGQHSPLDSPVTRASRALGFSELPSVGEEVQRAGYGEGAALVAEMTNPLGWVDGLDPIQAMLRGVGLTGKLGRELRTGKAALTAPSLPVVPRSFNELAEQVRQAPKTFAAMPKKWRSLTSTPSSTH